MSTKINKAIAAMAAVMTESIIKMLSQLSINELTAIGRASKAGRPAKVAPSEPAPSRSKTSKTTKTSKPSGSKSPKKSLAEMTKRGPGRPPKSAKTSPVTAEMRAVLADKFYAELSGHGESWVKMDVVVSKVSPKLPVEIARKIMNDLITSKRVERKGSTRDSRYRVVWEKWTDASPTAAGDAADTGAAADSAAAE